MGDNEGNRGKLKDSLQERLRSGGGEGGASPEGQPAPDGGGGGESSFQKALRGHISFGTVGLAQMTAFCRQLATLVEVGIPLLQCLQTLAERVEHPKLKRVVAQVARDVEEGSSFSDALANHPSVFSPLVVNVVRIGETGGILESSLNYLAEIMERRYEIRQRVKGALAYPVVVLIVCAVFVLGILGYAIPVFKEVYKDVSDLPALTQTVFNASTFVQTWWWLIVLIVVAIVLGLRYLIKTNLGIRKAWHGLVLKMPVSSSISTKVNVTRTCRTLSNLLKAGVPLLEALEITAETSENMVVADMLRKTYEHLERGGQIDKPLRDAGVFPALVIDMIAIGEEAGRLELMFDKVAETYDSDVDASIRMLNAILEPFMIIVMGLIVVVLALAVLLPYWQIGDAMADGGY